MLSVIGEWQISVHLAVAEFDLSTLIIESKQPFNQVIYERMCVCVAASHMRTV